MWSGIRPWLRRRQALESAEPELPEIEPEPEITAPLPHVTDEELDAGWDADTLATYRAERDKAANELILKSMEGKLGRPRPDVAAGALAHSRWAVPGIRRPVTPRNQRGKPK